MWHLKKQSKGLEKARENEHFDSDHRSEAPKGEERWSAQRDVRSGQYRTVLERIAFLMI